MILSAASLRRIRPVEPFIERTVTRGMSGGLSYAGIDLHARESVTLHPFRRFALLSTVERCVVPRDCMAMIFTKSSWARRGLLMTLTPGEPGWEGYWTLEVFSAVWRPLRIHAGDPIAQVIFVRLDQPVEGYPADGKYADQPPRPIPALEERA